MLKKYFVFSKLMAFVDEHCEVTDADMSNYCGDIEITGADSDGSTIKITVRMTEPKEEENDGN